MKVLHFTNRLFVYLMIYSFTACQKESSEVLNHQAAIEDKSTALPSDASSGATTRLLCFTAIAQLNGCIGENIVFGGTVVLTENTTVDGNEGVHYTRHWSVKGLTGYGVRPGGSFTSATCPAPRNYTANLRTGSTYEIIAGTEMFSVKDPNTTTVTPSAILSGEVFIHQGTIVFVNTATGERIVARHVILKNPGQYTPSSPLFKDGWYIQGKKC